MIYQKSLAEKGEVIIDDIVKEYEGTYSPCPKSKSPFKRKKGLVIEGGDIQMHWNYFYVSFVFLFLEFPCILHSSGVTAD